MANASHKHIGAGAQGKGDGTGALSDIEPADIPDNMVLSNRDKAQHGDQRGLDGNAVQTEQLRDHAGDRQVAEEGLTDVALADVPGDEPVDLPAEDDDGPDTLAEDFAAAGVTDPGQIAADPNEA